MFYQDPKLETVRMHHYLYVVDGGCNVVYCNPAVVGSNPAATQSLPRRAGGRAGGRAAGGGGGWFQ